MSQVRGAVAPTSGAQDSQAINEAALNQAIADVKERALVWAGTSARESRANARANRRRYLRRRRRVDRRRLCGQGLRSPESRGR